MGEEVRHRVDPVDLGERKKITATLGRVSQTREGGSRRKKCGVAS